MSAPRDVDAEGLAAVVRPLLDRALVAFDVDGVLAPIVQHAADARLTPGVRESLAGLADRTEVAILSGRSLDDLERLFEFPSGLHVIGSHGLEARGDAMRALDAVEQGRFDHLERLGARAVEAAGEGAWLEYKPASVVVHTRAADPLRSRAAVDELVQLAGGIDGAHVKPGRGVLELLARSASKGEALLILADRLGRSPLVFLGDDVTDEDAFAQMGDDDVPVRVGDGETVARYRLGGPPDVAELLTLLGRPDLATRA